MLLGRCINSYLVTSHPENTNINYYIYEVSSHDDLSSEISDRRIKKAKDSFANHIYIVLTIQHDGLVDTSFYNKFAALIDKLKDSSFVVSIEVPIEVLKSNEEIITLFSQSKFFNHIYLRISSLDYGQLIKSLRAANIEFSLLFFPKNSEDFIKLASAYWELLSLTDQIYWKFEPYNPKKNYFLTINSIFELKKRFQSLQNFEIKTIPRLQIYNNLIPQNYELEGQQNILWQFSTSEKQKKKISIIIPTYNNIQFLSNVLYHLINQDIDRNRYEIIIVDDGSLDNSSDILCKIFKSYQNSVNLKYIYWSKQHPIKGSQNFFRAGLARNLGVKHSNAAFLVFLDSDMLVPSDFVKTCIQNLEENDVIQFKRKHIHQKKSFNNPIYTEIESQDYYIEEANYWNNLFLCSEWKSLPDYWKYTCTYALGLKKSDFYLVGRFKKYYVSYGLEDTDLGYELHKAGKKFKIIDMYLLHLTSYNAQQYKNSFWKRRKLLKKTAKLFYLQHLDPDIYFTFYSFYHFENFDFRRSLLAFFKGTK